MRWQLWIIIICAFCTNMSGGFAQRPNQLSLIQKGYESKLDNPENPLDPCVRTIINDSKGRLWLKTCGVQEHLYATRILQYDGYQLHQIDPPELIEADQENINLLDFQDHLGLVGKIQHQHDSAQFFRYLIEEGELQTSPIIKGILMNTFKDRTGKYWTVSWQANICYIYSWDGTTLQQKGSFPLEKKLLFKDNTYGYGPYNSQLFVDQGELWFLSPRLPLIKYDLLSGQTDFFELDYFNKNFDTRSKPSTAINNENILGVWRKDRLLLFFPAFPNHYYDFKRGWQTIPGFPKRVVKEQFWGANYQINLRVDSLGNVLFFLEQEDQPRLARLLDIDDQWYDYGQMVSVPHPIVNFLSADFRQEIYLATWKGGYYVRARDNLGIKILLPDESMRDIVRISPDSLLFFSRSRGWVSYALSSNAQKAIQDQIPNPTIEVLNDGGRLLVDLKGKLWLHDLEKSIYPLNQADRPGNIHPIKNKFFRATFSPQDLLYFFSDDDGYLYAYDLNKRRLQQLIIKGQPFRNPSFIHAMHVDKYGQLWIASSVGLYRIDPQKDELEIIGLSDDFADFRFICLTEDQQGRLWLGSVYAGVHIYDPKSKKVIKIIDEAEGLGHNTVVSILEDEAGSFWVGTYNGLALLDNQGQLITNLYPRHGLSHWEFNRRSALKTQDGKLWMGSLQGMNIIDPEQVKTKLRAADQTKIYLRELSYFQEDLERVQAWINPDVKSLKTLVLAANHRYLRLSMGMSNQGYSKRNRFAYQLEGIHKDWQFLGYQHQLNLNDLPPGRYNLLLRGIDHRGNWSETLSLPIKARDYFYRQWWFYVLCSLPFLTFALAWARRLRREKQVLTIEVARRTKQISDDKELIEQQAIELQQLDGLKSKFFANISHELRTPITLISGPAELLNQKKNIRQDEESYRYLQLIQQHSRKLQQLVEEMLELAKIDAGAIQLNQVAVPLYSFCQQIFSGFQTLATSQGIEYRFDFQAERTLVTHTDPRRLEKILTNLLFNAFKFTSSGGHISLQVYTSNGQICFSLIDTGAGIPAEDLPQLFDRYYQAQNQQKTKSLGTGIGLSLSRELAQLLDGDISVSSQLGQGSTFTLCLPHRTVPKSADTKEDYLVAKPYLPQVVTVWQPEEISANNRLLIVEDNQELAQFLHDLLSKNYQIKIFANGQEALSYLQTATAENKGIDLIITDLTMPVMDGYQLIENLKQDSQFSQIPLIVLTANNQTPNKIKTLRMGVDDYLTKPFSAEELRTRVHNLIQFSHARSGKGQLAFPSPKSTTNTTFHHNWLVEVEQACLNALERQIDLKMPHLSTVLSLSERQVSRRLKQLTGLTGGQYIQEVRLQRARQLLEQGHFPTVAEVAIACGFSSHSYFSQLFSQRFGKQPSDYLILKGKE